MCWLYHALQKLKVDLDSGFWFFRGCNFNCDVLVDQILNYRLYGIIGVRNSEDVLKIILNDFDRYVSGLPSLSE